MKTSTLPITAPQWILIDANEQNLGRLATRVALLLRGKHKVSFSPHQPCGDHVVVINAGKLKFHPVKLYRKTYAKHSGFIGHLKVQSLGQLMEKDPADVIVRAVKGMLPANRLRIQLLKRLHVSVDEKHDHEAQKPVPIDPPKS